MTAQPLHPLGHVRGAVDSSARRFAHRRRCHRQPTPRVAPSPDHRYGPVPSVMAPRPRDTWTGFEFVAVVLTARPGPASAAQTLPAVAALRHGRFASVSVAGRRASCVTDDSRAFRWLAGERVASRTIRERFGGWPASELRHGRFASVSVAGRRGCCVTDDPPGTAATEHPRQRPRGVRTDWRKPCHTLGVHRSA